MLFRNQEGKVPGEKAAGKPEGGVVQENIKTQGEKSWLIKTLSDFPICPEQME